MAALVKQAAVGKGAKVMQPAFLPTRAQEEVRSARRHRWANLPPLVSEYEQITDAQPVDQPFKLLTSLPTWGKLGLEHEMGIRGIEMAVSQQHKMGDPVFGIYRSHEEFLQASLEAKHLIDFACPLPEILVKNIVRVLNDCPKLVNARRNLEVPKRLAKQLSEEECKLHEQLAPELARVLKGKSLLVWKELMAQTGFDDPSLFDEPVSGFNLVGQAKSSPQFPKGFVMQQTPDELRRKAIWLRKANVVK